MPAGLGGVGAQCGLCASALGLRAGEETAGTELGATPPRLPQAPPRAPLFQSPPARHPAVSRASPAAFPAHTPGTARTVPQSWARRGGVLRREDGPRRSPQFRDACGRRTPNPTPQLPHAARLSIPAPVLRAWWLSSTRLGRRSQTAGPGEPRKLRRRGEPGAPPRPQPSAARAVAASVCAPGRGLTEETGWSARSAGRAAPD